MKYKLLSKNEFKRALSSYPSEQMQLIDLREPEEYNYWHVSGAVNYSYETIEEWSKTLNIRYPVLLYCCHGNESIRAARYLGSRGYQVASLIGGVGVRK